MFKIEKGIKPKEHGESWHETLEAMQVGDSFAVSYNQAGSAGCKAYQAFKHVPSKRFILRRWESGYRVWRVK